MKHICAFLLALVMIYPMVSMASSGDDQDIAKCQRIWSSHPASKVCRNGEIHADREENNILSCSWTEGVCFDASCREVRMNSGGAYFDASSDSLYFDGSQITKQDRQQSRQSMQQRTVCPEHNINYPGAGIR